MRVLQRVQAGVPHRRGHGQDEDRVALPTAKAEGPSLQGSPRRLAPPTRALGPPVPLLPPPARPLALVGPHDRAAERLQRSPRPSALERPSLPFRDRTEPRPARRCARGRAPGGHLHHLVRARGGPERAARARAGRLSRSSSDGRAATALLRSDVSLGRSGRRGAERGPDRAQHPRAAAGARRSGGRTRAVLSPHAPRRAPLDGPRSGDCPAGLQGRSLGGVDPHPSGPPAGSRFPSTPW